MTDPAAASRVYERVEKLIETASTREWCEDDVALSYALTHSARRLLARVRELEAGLTEYGQHKSNCKGIIRWITDQPGPRYKGPCTCGLAALVNEEQTG